MEEEKSFKEKAVETGIKLKKTGSKIGKIAGFIASNAAWIIPVIAIFIAVVVLIAFAQTVYDNLTNIFKGGDNAYISSVSGISEDYFYGARIIYKDDTQANTEIEISFGNYVCNVLVKIAEKQGISLKFNVPSEYNPSINYEYINSAIIEMVNAITKPEMAYTSENYRQGIESINHFGLTTAEKTEVNLALKDYFNNNLTQIFNFDNQTILEGQIAQVLSLETKTNLDFVSEKLFVKDMLLNNDNLKLGKLNYVAFIYMPKQDITISYLNYLFYIESETEVVDYSINNKIDGVVTEIKSGTADYTWANSKDGFIKEEKIEQEISVKAFDNYNANYSNILLENNISICDIAEYDYKNNTNILSEYLYKNTENIIEYLPKNNGLYLTFNSNIPFAFGEYEITVK